MIGAKKHTVEEKITKWEKILAPLINLHGEDSSTNNEVYLTNKFLYDLREIKATEDEMKEIVRETIEWLKSVEGNDQMEANPDATILELEKLL